MDKISDKKIRQKVFDKYNGKCAYCGTDINISSFTMDHIIPLYRGYTDQDLSKYGKSKGKNIVENYNPCCFSCNSSKSTFTLEKWKEEISKKYDRLLRDDSTFRLLNRFGLCIRNDSEIKFYYERIL